MFSTSCYYALQGMIYIALHSDEEQNVDLKQIASEQNIPKHFLSKILQLMVKNNLLKSMKGPTGGFRLSKPANKITLIEIIEATDGLDVFNKCGIGLKHCDDENPCPIHEDYKKVRSTIKNLFETKTLLELTEDIKKGESIVNLKNTGNE